MAGSLIYRARRMLIEAGLSVAMLVWKLDAWEIDVGKHRMLLKNSPFTTIG